MLARGWGAVMRVDARAARLAFGFAMGLTVLSSAACSAPRRVQAPIEYPADAKLECSKLSLDMIDPRLPGAVGGEPGARQLAWPPDFEAAARGRLSRIALGQGPSVVIAGRVGVADELELVDARGEITRVSVTLHFDVSLEGGTLVRRAESHSSYDIPRHEATPEEIEIVLSATALDAFDRYWASRTTLASLNRELEAHTKRLGSVPAAVTNAP